MRDERVFIFMSENKIVLHYDFHLLNKGSNPLIKNIFCDWNFNVALYLMLLGNSYPYFGEFSVRELSEKYHDNICRYMLKNKDLLTDGVILELIDNEDIKTIECLINIGYSFSMNIFEYAVNKGNKRVIVMVYKSLLDDGFDEICMVDKLIEYNKYESIEELFCKKPSFDKVSSVCE